MKPLHSVPREKEKFSWKDITSSINNLSVSFDDFTRVANNTWRTLDYTSFGDTSRTYTINVPMASGVIWNSDWFYGISTGVIDGSL